MESDLLDLPGLNTWLASVLHRRGRVDPAAVSRLLAGALQPDASGGARTLARALLDEGLVTPAELSGCLREAQALAADTPTVGPRPGVAGEWLPGTQVGDLTIVRRVGAGGMGEVYLAEGPEGQVAVKSLPVGASADERRRFHREGKAASGPTPHPNVLQVHRHGVAPGDRPYLVMDYAPGGDLRELLLAGPLPPRRAATVARDLARGLAHMHAHGVLHRDLKPANVLFDADGVPQLVDFGLAKIEGGTTLTRTGMVMGTPAYMPPEQAEGIADRIDVRSDVYGLGAVLYHCLTGAPPFPGQTLVEILSKVLNSEPRPPSELNPQVPPALDRVCLKAIRREPEDRYPSAAAFADALDAALRGEGPAPEPGARALWVGLAVAIVAIGLGVTVRTLRSAPTPTPTPAQTPTASDTVLPTPAPPAAPPQPGGVSWRLAPGERLQLTAKAVTTNRIGVNNAKTTGSQRFRVEVLATDGKQARLGFTFEQLKIELVDSVQPTRNDLFDSDDPKHRDHELQRAIGRGFELVLDQDTGRIVKVVGAPELYEHVHPSGTSPQSGPLTLRAYRSGPPIRELFNRMLHCFPQDADRETPPERMTWNRLERFEPRGDVQEALLVIVRLLGGNARRRRFDAKRLRLPKAFRLEPGPRDGRRVSWIGSCRVQLPLGGLQRKVTGRVEWRAGKLINGTITEEVRHTHLGYLQTRAEIELRPAPR